MPDEPLTETTRPSPAAGARGSGTDDVGRGFFDVVLGQRACRRFAARPVDDDLVQRCLEAAIHAPSAENRQPWRFVVVRDQRLRTAICELNRRAWRGGGRQHSEGRLEPSLLADVHHGAEAGMGTAPVLVVVGGDAELGVEATLPASVYPATQNLLLAASALGLGSAMTTLVTLFADDLRQLLDLPPSVRPMAVVPLGWPERPLGPPRRRPLPERVYRDRYGDSW